MKRFIIIISIILIGLTEAISQVTDKFLIKAALLAESKQYNEALDAIEQSSTVENKSYTRILADIQCGLKNYQNAVDLYKKLDENDPGSYSLELAKCYAFLGDQSKSMENLNIYFTQKNKLPISKIIRNEAFNEFSSNAEWQKMWYNVDYSDVELKVNQVNSVSENGYNEYANNILEEALRKYPSNPELLYNQSKYFMERKMYNASEKSINQALEKSGVDKYQYQKSQIQQKNNKLRDALSAINEAIGKNPFNLKYYLTRIELNRSLGNTVDVNKDVQLIDFCMPESAEVQISKIQIEADKGNYLNAIDGLNTLIAKDQTNKTYYILRGKLDLKVQRLQDADEDFGMALDLNPSDSEANLGRGIAKHELDDTAAACYYWQKASNEGNREALDYLNKYCGK